MPTQSAADNLGFWGTLSGAIAAIGLALAGATLGLIRWLIRLGQDVDDLKEDRLRAERRMDARDTEVNLKFDLQGHNMRAAVGEVQRAMDGRMVAIEKKLNQTHDSQIRLEATISEWMKRQQ